MCFQNNGKTAQAARCSKSRIMNKAIDYVLSVDTFKQQCVVRKGILQSPRLKYHVQTIVIEQYLSSNAIYEHKFLEKIKKLYKQAGKCDDQQQFENIFEDAIVYTPEGFTSDSPIYPMKSTPVKKPCDRRSLRMFTNIFDVKKRRAAR